MNDIREQIRDRRDAVNWCSREGGTWVELGEKFAEDADTMGKMLAVVEAVQAFVDEADREGLLIGCGENYPGEKEGKYGKGIRKALAALAQDPECEVHRYLMPDGKCTCEPVLGRQTHE